MRKTLTIVVMLALVLTLIVYLLKPTPQWCYQQGIDTLDNTAIPKPIRYSKANIFFRAAIYLDPSYIPPYYDLIRGYLSLAYMGTDDNNKDVYSPAGLAMAKRWLDKAAILAPDTAELHFCRSQYVFSLKRFEEAIKEAQKAITIDPENGRYYSEIGMVLFEQYLETKDRYYASQAIKELKKSLNYKMKKRFRAAVFDYIGMAYDLAFHKREIALDYYVLSQNADPNDYISKMHYWQIADEVEQNSADREKRKQNYALSVKECIQSNKMKALCETAKQYLDYCDYPEAEKVFQQVIEKQPKNYEAIYMLGEVYVDEGDLDKALEQFYQAVSINKKYADAYASIGYVYYLKGDPVKSKEANLKCVAIDPKSSIGNYNLGIGCFRGGAAEESIKYLQKCLEIDPRDGDIYYYIGRIHYDSKDKSLAEEYLRKAVDFDTEITDCYLRLAGIYYRQQKYCQAVPLLEKALEIDPHPFTANNLACCFVRLDDNQEVAVELAEYAVSLSPDKPLYLTTLNKAYINLGNKYKREGSWLKAWHCYRQAKKAIKRDHNQST